VRGVTPLDQYISVLTLGEIERGIRRMPDGDRRQRLLQWANRQLPQQFLGRVLPVDEAVAMAWGSLTADGAAAGLTVHVVDGLILATARVHQLVVATRNVADFTGLGVPVVDPWTGSLHR
jgi:predicted nucleic acid-binding protein